MTYEEVALHIDKYYKRGTCGVARAHRGIKIKFDGKMRTVAYMIYKGALHNRISEMKALKKITSILRMRRLEFISEMFKFLAS